MAASTYCSAISACVCAFYRSVTISREISRYFASIQRNIHREGHRPLLTAIFSRGNASGRYASLLDFFLIAAKDVIGALLEANVIALFGKEDVTKIDTEKNAYDYQYEEEESKMPIPRCMDFMTSI